MDLLDALIERNPETALRPGAHPAPQAAAEEAIRNLYVQSLKAKLELCRIVGAGLMRDLESPGFPARKKRESFYRWFDVTRDGDILEFVFELLRRHEREARTSNSLKKPPQRAGQQAAAVRGVRCNAAGRASASSF